MSSWQTRVVNEHSPENSQGCSESGQTSEAEVKVIIGDETLKSELYEDEEYETTESSVEDRDSDVDDKFLLGYKKRPEASVNIQSSENPDETERSDAVCEILRDVT